MRIKRTLLMFGALHLLACVEQAPELSASERAALQGHILTEAPHPQHELDVSFENRVRIVGYDVDVETVSPGQPFTVTWYWQSMQRLDSNWRIFTHLADGRGENRVNQDGTGVVRQRYQPGRWRDREYIKDSQTITLPADWNSDRVVFYMGLWDGESRRLSVVRGPHDSEDRARVLSLPVGGARTEVRPPAPVPSMRASRAAQAPRIDGRLDDAAWTAAEASRAFVNTLNGSASEFSATVKTAWDADRFYAAFDVADTHLASTLRGRDAHLWEQDAVEIMVDPDGDGRNYFELQVAPTGEVFDTRYDSRRVPGPIGHADWNAEIEAKVVTRGRVNDDEADEGYTVELAIPWSSFKNPDGSPMSAPSAGSNWRFNFYVMDTQANGQRSCGWSPTLEGDFHVPSRFGRVTWNDPSVSAAALPSDPAAARPRLNVEALRALRDAPRLPPELARIPRTDESARHHQDRALTPIRPH